VIAMLKKVITWGLVIFVIYYLISDPGGAANVVHSILNGLADAGRSLANFVSSL
jgi:hypothetical protein